jgi:phosphatidate cytidylyltransferase
MKVLAGLSAFWSVLSEINMSRLIPGLALAACWLLLLLYGHFLLFFLVMAVVIMVGAQEYIKMALPEEDIFFRVYFAVLSFFPVLCAGFIPSLGLPGGLLLSLLFLTGYILYYYSRLQDALLFFSRVFFGISYVGFLGAYLVLLYQIPEGSSWILVLTAITAGSDSGAYYSGRAFGKNKLCSKISPNKTVEGAVGGLVTGIVVAVLMTILLRLQVSWFFLVSATIILTGVGIVGDLTESIIKRATGSKDSGTLLGGHGGVLDRVDSLLFAAPVLYYLLRIYQGVSVVIP